jgi:hypothetical protein
MAASNKLDMIEKTHSLHMKRKNWTGRPKQAKRQAAERLQWSWASANLDHRSAIVHPRNAAKLLPLPLLLGRKTL